MRYFLDTEFIDSNQDLQLISIGIYAEDGRTLYMVSSEFDEALAGKWVKENVLPKLGPNRPLKRGKMAWKIRNFLKDDKDISFYAYFGAYDWVLFCKIFKRMVNLPGHFPMFYFDLKQRLKERGLTSKWVEENAPQSKDGEHNALSDAKWNFKLYKALKHYDRQNIIT